MPKDNNKNLEEILREIKREMEEVPSVNDEHYREFLSWAIEFPELARERYPRNYKMIEKAASEVTAWEMARIYNALLKNIPLNIEEANKAIGGLRLKKLKEVLEVLKRYKELGERTTEPIIKAAYKECGSFFDEFIPIVEKGLNASPTEKEMSTSKVLDWKSLFKESEEADKVLGFLEEYLSSTGQWIVEPIGRHLVALCTDLEKKGYFKSHNTISNPVKASAFNIQFEANLSAKNFQPQERNKAEDFREHFKHIPFYKPTR
ncbi:hypothetical protein TH63_00380 [Rufibacter radiotolerans]|uniref:Uncharacterized protein n=1 Tax=Rufibacter radiotolerans TaxID=1379910 RepID=A0A0H4W1Y4_9BACT|nr:hypothetical protein [Rufibacter radiotolerans]AKQ44441.1 hypothetical protein TH63_00380 [Rufibacter radiotolerans]